ncbi:HEAT repeat domain-containing protein [Tautonia marina]|uniref:HEAT repeat domain-containing protein n=1 Tax=Tautonia marina TaxID=2653855 RepID=UPI00126076C2|nr:HEAT repeat domain-containing protein [Tautonia marina]
MAARRSLDDKLAALRALRGQSLTNEQKAELRARIGDRSNLVVAAAAAIAGENSLVECAGELEAAFDRFLINPLKDDKLCRAKLGIVQALNDMEHPDSGVFLKAARHVQLEPVWGGSEDSAAPLRAAGVLALARVEGTGALPLLVDALADPAEDVRSAAATALGAVGGEAAGLVLRLKARIGDTDPDVFSECLGGLLAVDASEYLTLVVTYLDPSDPIGCESAALALGKSRLAEALDPLVECWRHSSSSELKRHLLLAVAILRRPAAFDFLAELVATGPEPDAAEALAVLGIHKDDPLIRERVKSVVEERDRPAIRAAFDRAFG